MTPTPMPGPGRSQGGAAARWRLPVAVMIMVAGELLAVYSMAHFVAWGWHLLGLGLLFAVLAWWTRDDLRRIGTGRLVVITLVVQVVGLVVFPLTSDDVYRYIWDGRVQLAGIDPYRYVPLDPAVAWLRDPMLFPSGRPPMINRPTVPTLYPPGAQAWFAAVATVAPPGWALMALRCGMVAAVVATTVVISRVLRSDRGLSLLYGANPLIMIEAGNGGHLDALVGLAIAGVAWCAVRRRHWLAGICLGLAGSLKLIPLLLLPVFLRRGRWRTTLVAVGMTAGGYVPHVLLAGALVLGYLPGYWAEEGYGSGGRFALLAWLPSGPVRTVVAMIIAALLAGLAVWRSAREPVQVTCTWLFGSSFLVATPIYPWYAMPLLVLLIMARRWEWLAVWAACYVAFVFDHTTAAQTMAYGAALIIVLAVVWRRSRGFGDHRTARARVSVGDVIVS